MKTRILSGLLLLPLLAVVYLGGWLLHLLCFAIAVLGLRELAGGFRHMDVKIDLRIGYGATILLYGGSLLVPGADFLLLWVVVAAVASMLTLFDRERRKPADAMATFLGLVYVVFFSYHAVLIDRSSEPVFLWFVLLAAFGTDILAYFSGYLFGRHKLCPAISPKKTVEGAIGGTLGSVLLCTGAAVLLVPHLLFQSAAIGLLGSIAAQLGDLSASALKRHMEIKDYGDLIPGHGGVLDRFDSVLFTAPFVYYVVLFAV